VRGSKDYTVVNTPESCCISANCEDHQYYQEGCAKALQDFILSAGIILGGVAIGLSIIEVSLCQTHVCGHEFESRLK